VLISDVITGRYIVWKSLGRMWGYIFLSLYSQAGESHLAGVPNATNYHLRKTQNKVAAAQTLCCKCSLSQTNKKKTVCIFCAAMHMCTFWAYQGMLSPLVSVCLYFHALHNCIHDSGDNATVGTMQWLFNNCLLAQSAKDLAIVTQLELMWLA